MGEVIMSSPADSIVSVEWLNDNLDKVVVLDASFYLPTSNKNADVEFDAAHIPNALRWDIDKIARPDAFGLPHMMPSTAQILAEAGARGINQNTHVVIYDQVGIFSSPRLWFTLKTVAHEKVSVLNGGLPAWIKAGYPTQSGAPVPAVTKSYQLDAKPGRLATCHLKTMISSLERDDTIIMDARPEARFKGEAPEPRAGLTSGHMPHSMSLPFTKFVKDGELLSKDQIASIFEEAGVNLNKQLITSCGSGVSAAVINFALYQLGKTALLYDGSWAEWGDPANGMPIVTD